MDIFGSKARAKKKRDQAKKKLKEVQEAATPPKDIPPETQVPKPPISEFVIPKQIPIELTRLKSDGSRAVIRKGRVTLIQRFAGGKDVFFFYVGKMGYYIDPAKIIKVETKGRRGKIKVLEKLVYDVLHSEPLNQEGKLDWSWDVEHLLRDSGMDQYITVATFESGFQLTSNLLKAMLISGVLGTFLGLAINGSAHIIPITQIHWIP